MKVSDGYLSRVFSGAIEFRMEYIFGIAKALQLTPEEPVAFVYPIPKEPMSPAAYELWQRIGVAPPVRPSLAPKEEGKSATSEVDTERLLRQALGRVFGDLANTLREGEAPDDPSR